MVQSWSPTEKTERGRRLITQKTRAPPPKPQRPLESGRTAFRSKNMVPAFELVEKEIHKSLQSMKAGTFMPSDLRSYDVFNSWLLRGACYAGELELPILQAVQVEPKRLIPFSHARATSGDLSDACIHFFEHDCKFQCVWNTPSRYLSLFKKCEVVIGPDFSMYRNMPAAMQQGNCFRGRAISYWLQTEGVQVIPNVRFSDDRSWSYCFDGLPGQAILAVGSHGCLREREDRRWFEEGLYELFCRLSPHTLVVYGATPEEIFGPYERAGVRILGFESTFAQTHRGSGRHGDR